MIPLLPCGFNGACQLFFMIPLFIVMGCHLTHCVSHLVMIKGCEPQKIEAPHSPLTHTQSTKSSWTLKSEPCKAPWSGPAVDACTREKALGNNRPWAAGPPGVDSGHWGREEVALETVLSSPNSTDAARVHRGIPGPATGQHPHTDGLTTGPLRVLCLWDCLFRIPKGKGPTGEGPQCNYAPLNNHQSRSRIPNGFRLALGARCLGT